jgi:hypothetical protein
MGFRDIRKRQVVDLQYLVSFDNGSASGARSSSVPRATTYTMCVPFSQATGVKGLLAARCSPYPRILCLLSLSDRVIAHGANVFFVSHRDVVAIRILLVVVGGNFHINVRSEIRPEMSIVQASDGLPQSVHVLDSKDTHLTEGQIDCVFTMEGSTADECSLSQGPIQY